MSAKTSTLKRPGSSSGRLEGVKSAAISTFVFLAASTFRIVPVQQVIVLANARHKKDGKNFPEANLSEGLKYKYQRTSRVYDLLDLPWERVYQKWRPSFVDGMEGDVVEVAVGTGRNLTYYGHGVNLVAIDISQSMIRQAEARLQKEKSTLVSVVFTVADAVHLDQVLSEKCADWVLSSFLFCVLPDELQIKALQQMHYILRPGGRFRLVEIVYSKKSKAKAFTQWWYSPFVEFMYGAKFNRRTLEHLKTIPGLQITSTRWLSQDGSDTHLLIEGRRVD